VLFTCLYCSEGHIHACLDFAKTRSAFQNHVMMIRRDTITELSAWRSLYLGHRRYQVNSPYSTQPVHCSPMRPFLFFHGPAATLAQQAREFKSISSLQQDVHLTRDWRCRQTLQSTLRSATYLAKSKEVQDCTT
jgi:hypothetical protein